MPANIRSLSPARLAALHAGEPSTNLVECLALDQRLLLRTVLREQADEALAAAADETLGPLPKGISKQMSAICDALAAATPAQRAPDVMQRLSAHRSDTVRSWAVFWRVRAEPLSLREKLDRCLPFARDPHFGVREWAWMAVRPSIAAAPREAIGMLTPWVRDEHPFVRRFAIESTRPRGVWSAHIELLKREPHHAERLLDPLRAEPEKYVQDSVANWINDASKTQPEWARTLCQGWLRESSARSTERIAKRALRSVEKR